jgi:hypothetical protein
MDDDPLGSEGSPFSPDEQRRFGRAALVFTVLDLLAILTGAAWNLAPHPLRGWWLLAAVTCGASATLATGIAVSWAVRSRRRTGTWWPRGPSIGA